MKSNQRKALITAGTMTIITIVAALMLCRRKAVKKLYIVGNGFDLYHGIPSSYLQFRDYLKQADEEVFGALEKYLYLYGDTEWNQFESNLANLDPEELLDEMGIFLGDRGGDWKDSMYHDFQYEIGKALDTLGQKMHKLFLEWVLQLNIEHTSNMPKLVLPKDQAYISFNYTNSLEELYKIHEKRILYIHNKATGTNSSIILGHGWENHRKVLESKPITYEDFVDGNYATEEDWQYKEAKELIEDYFKTSYKNAPQIIRANNRFFNKLKCIEEIYVMGHAMSKVDRKYFEVIAQNIDIQKVKWIISYYNKEDVMNCTNTLERLGIDSRLIEFKRLESFFSKQMNLF